MDEKNNTSITAKVRSLTDAGFSDAEIDKILETFTSEHKVDVKAHNEKVEETIDFTKKQNVYTLVIISIIACIIGLAFLYGNAHNGMYFILAGFIVILSGGIFSAIKTIPFALDKVRFFCKK